MYGNCIDVLLAICLFIARSYVCFYALRQVGVARAVQGKGDAAYESAAAHFRPHLAFVLGRPGSGKTSACGALRDTLGYVPLSLDALVAKEAESGSVFGRDIAALVSGD